MKTREFPEPIMRQEVEQEISRLMQKGLEVNRWREDFEEWSRKRLWAEKYQKAKLATLERWAGGALRARRVLDLGTGRGGLSVAMKLLGARVTAMDLRRRNCRIARLRASRYDLALDAACAVGEHLPFAQGSFDLVVCKDVTEHCRSPRALLGEIARVLAPGGCAYVTFINRLAWDDPHYHLRGINFLPHFLAERVIAWRGRSKPSIRDLQRLSDMHYFTRFGARRVCRQAGLEYVDVSLARLEGERFRALRRAAHRWLSLGAHTFEAVLRKRPA